MTSIYLQTLVKYLLFNRSHNHTFCSMEQTNDPTSGFRATGVFPVNRYAISLPGKRPRLSGTPTAVLAEKQEINFYLPTCKKAELSREEQTVLTKICEFNFSMTVALINFVVNSSFSGIINSRLPCPFTVISTIFYCILTRCTEVKAVGIFCNSQASKKLGSSKLTTGICTLCRDVETCFSWSI